MTRRTQLAIALALIAAPLTARAQQSAIDTAWIRANYAKREVQIRARTRRRA